MTFFCLFLPGASVQPPSVLNLDYYLLQLNSKLDTLTSKMETLDSKVETLDSKVEILDSKMETHDLKIDSKMETLNSKIDTLDSKIDSKIETHDLKIDSKMETLDSKVETLGSKVETLDSKVETTQSSLNSKLNTLASKMETLDSKIQTLDSNLDSKMETLHSRIETTQTSLQTHSQQTNALNSKLDTLTTTTAQLSTEHHNLQTSIPDVECTDSGGSLELYQNLQNNLTRQLQSIQRGVDTLHGDDGTYTCRGTSGWRRVVYLDMTDSSTTCPSGWQLTGYSKRTCGRVSTGFYTCDSATFPVSGGEYTRVCGRIKAYQWGQALAFHMYHAGTVNTISSGYVNGVSVTHGSPQQHIWTFAAGLSEGNPSWNTICPCDDSSSEIRVPPFVGEDYFCESGVNGNWYLSSRNALHSTDTLWDGEDCLTSSTCCSRRNPPYFIKQLPTPTTDDIEARICLELFSHYSNIAVELVELYVQ